MVLADRKMAPKNPSAWQTLCFGRNNKLCKDRMHSQGVAMKDMDQLDENNKIKHEKLLQRTYMAL